MGRLREITRTAAFAWAPGTGPPLIVTGTRAGAVDVDFSDDIQLELWDLALDDPDKGGELQPVGSIGVDSRFHDIAWSQPSEDYPRGIIAGALESGALDLWDAEKLRTDASNSYLGRSTQHNGAIKALQFNPAKHHILATVGAKGQVWVHDLSDPTNHEGAFKLENKAATRADDFETLDWNKKVPHILATGSNAGFSIWDMKTKKETITLLVPGKKKVSAVAWDPDVPTRLVTAIPDDQTPVVHVWDLRNSNAPEKTLRGHEQGVLSLSWCGQDTDLLLSCGMDNRTICWNPHTGQSLGEFPLITNWAFQTRFNPRNPSLVATASFDGKITVKTIQNTKQDTAQAPAAPLDGEDFFSKVQTAPQGAAFSLSQPPKWLKRPTGVSFAFGGKLVKFGPSGDDGKSKITISTFSIDTAIGSATEEFDAALNSGDLAKICESRIGEATTEEEKADWTVIETLISNSPRTKLVDYLGFSDKKEEGAETQVKEVFQANGIGEDGASFFDGADTGDNFLSQLASSKSAKTSNPFQIYTGAESAADKSITRALMLGSFEAALDICLKENRLSDAFMIAICGGQKCIDKAQAAYFKGRADGPNYLRLLASVVGKNLWDVVHNADLKDWKDVMATLCTFADQTEFPDLCEALGDRLEASISDSDITDAGSLRKDATFCYLAGSKLEKVVGNWAQELQEHEAAGLERPENGTSFSVHAKSLQGFIEKVTVFRQVTNFKDPERQQPSGWKLAPLYAKYSEYADIAAATGKMQIAEKYLDLLPDKYPAADVARNRVKQATRKATPQATQKQVATGAAQRAQRVVSASYQPGPAVPAQQPSASPYTPAGAPASIPANQPQTGYPGSVGGSNAYTPAGYQPPQAPQQPSYGTPAQYGGYHPPHQQHQSIPPPPRNFTASPSAPPPAAKNAANVGQWNDTPDFGNKPISRRGTPGIGANLITSPFPNQPSTAAPPPAGFSPSYPPGPPQRSTPPIAPPPKGPPRLMSPSLSGQPPTSRPSSSVANTYAPPQAPASFTSPPTQPPVPRGTSPYNPPPAAAPPSNRYAPTPSAQPTPSQGMPPPQRQIAPPPNPYASSQYAPSPMSQPPPSQMQAPPPPPSTRSGPPPSGPPRSGPPGGPQGGHQKAASIERPGTGQSQKSIPAARKYPRGDREHIPQSSRKIYDVLSAEMRHVSTNAPGGPNGKFKKHLEDTDHRLAILFDHLNNEELLTPDTIQEMNELAGFLQNKQFDEAMATCTDLITNKTDQGTDWMTGVKRLIQFGKNTPGAR